MTIIHQNNPKNQYSLINADILTWAAGYTGPKYMACFCDPPYHLTSITKRFGKPGSAPAKVGVYNRGSKGFMNQDWDSTGEDGLGIAFRPETWAALSQHLYPGAFILAFAGTRGYHRMACAMEDSGLIIHPAMVWTFLSGFPKASRIDTQIDRAAGVEREVIASDRPQFGINKTRVEQGYRPNLVKNGNITAPATPLAQTWAGHRYGLQALKPALEFIAVAQVPYEGRPVDCITRTGAGAWNIDGSRIAIEEELPNYSKPGVAANGITYQLGETPAGDHPDSVRHNALGRWPANLLLDESGAELLDRQSGESASHQGHRDPNGSMGYHGGASGTEFRMDGHDDSGGASRMFFQSHWQYEILEQLENADPLKYEPKVSTTEREAGLGDLPLQTRNRVNSGGLENDPKFAPTQMKNNHPTLKPISLCKYLSTLIIPPDAYAPRRLLIPFCGSGSEMIGAILAGWEEVTGIEMTPAYIPIAKKRLAWWSQWPGWGQTDVDKILASLGEDVPTEQLSLFEAAR